MTKKRNTKRLGKTRHIGFQAPAEMIEQLQSRAITHRPALTFTQICLLYLAEGLERAELADKEDGGVSR